MPSDRFSVMLIIVGDDLDPDYVTHQLAMAPKKVWRRGEIKTATLPDGSLYSFNSTHEQGGWKKWLENEERHNMSLSEQVDLWCERLTPKQQVLKELKSKGYELVLDFHIMSHGSTFIAIVNSALKQIAELGFQIEVTYSYCEMEK